MTALTMTNDTFFVAPRAPRISFAARLAAIQARREQLEPVLGVTGVAVRVALALVPFSGLALLFATV
jgi:hypothetical protein